MKTPFLTYIERMIIREVPKSFTAERLNLLIAQKKLCRSIGEILALEQISKIWPFNKLK